jgi:hypothetical protein
MYKDYFGKNETARNIFNLLNFVELDKRDKEYQTNEENYANRCIKEGLIGI